MSSTSACNPAVMELSDHQLGYVQCSVCATILLVSVPCSSSLLKVVTVKCGHCTCLLSVGLQLSASFFPLHLLASSLGDDEDQEKHELSSKAASHKGGTNTDYGEGDEEERKESSPLNPTVNKPPEKRQRAPSAYNRFIKEEIQRIKAREPNISHKEAFSTAAKNWAHFPQYKHSAKQGKGESCSTSVGDLGKKARGDGDRDDQADGRSEGFQERKASRQYL